MNKKHVEGLSHGETINIDTDGCLIQWDKSSEDAAAHAAYNCGETVEEFGIENLTPKELARLKFLHHKTIHNIEEKDKETA